MGVPRSTNRRPEWILIRRPFAFKVQLYCYSSKCAIHIKINSIMNLGSHCSKQWSFVWYCESYCENYLIPIHHKEPAPPTSRAGVELASACEESVEMFTSMKYALNSIFHGCKHFHTACSVDHV